MKSERTVSFSHPIVVWSDDLRYFDRYLQKNFTEIKYEIILEDDTKLTPDNLDDLLIYENPNFKRIGKLSITSSDKILDNKLEIIIGKTGFFSSDTAVVSFMLSDAQQQFSIEDEVINRVKSMKPWYFWLHIINFKLLLPVLPGLILFLSSFVLVFKKLFGFIPLSAPSSSFNDTGFTELEGNILLLVFLGVLFLIGYLIDRSRNFLYPKYFFCIGRQIKEFEKRRNIAYLIFGVIVLGVLINVISTYILLPLS